MDIVTGALLTPITTLCTLYLKWMTNLMTNGKRGEEHLFLQNILHILI